MRGHVEVVRCLLEHGADVGITNQQNRQDIALSKQINVSYITYTSRYNAVSNTMSCDSMQNSMYHRGLQIRCYTQLAATIEAVPACTAASASLLRVMMMAWLRKSPIKCNLPNFPMVGSYRLVISPDDSADLCRNTCTAVMGNCWCCP